MCNPTCKATTVLNVAMAILEASLGSAQDIGAAVCEIVAARPRTSQRQHINLCFDLLRWWWWLGTLALDMTSTIYGFRLTRWSIDVHSTHMEKNGRKSIRRASAASVRNHCPGRLCNPRRSPECSPMDHLAKAQMKGPSIQSDEHRIERGLLECVSHAFSLSISSHSKPRHIQVQGLCSSHP